MSQFDYLRICSEPSVWEHWWYFDGTNDAVSTPHNDDFQYDSAAGTWLIGFRPDYSGGATQYLIDKGPQSGTPSYRDFITFNVSDPGGNDRTYRSDMNRVSGGGYVNNANPTNLPWPTENVMTAKRWVHATQRSYGAIVDSAGFHDSYTAGAGLYATEAGVGPVYIGAKWILTDISDGFKGRIYFAAWWKGTNLSQANIEGVFDGTIPPETISPTLYINFNKTVGATVTPDVQAGPNAPYTFTVVGTPVLNGP